MTRAASPSTLFCDDGSDPAVSTGNCDALAEAMRAEVCRALAGGVACLLTVEHMAQIVVPRVLMSVQHWQVQPVTVGFLVEDRVAVAAGATPVLVHGDNAAASCVSSNDADGDGGSSPDSRGDTGDCCVPETILGELERGKEGVPPRLRPGRWLVSGCDERACLSESSLSELSVRAGGSSSASCGCCAREETSSSSGRLCEASSPMRFVRWCRTDTRGAR